MQVRQRITFFVFLSLGITTLAVIGCSASLYQPGPRDASANASLQELNQGREIFVQHCGTCHALPMPERFTADKWHEVLAMMQPRARISDTEKELVFKYLSARSRQAGTDVGAGGK